MLIFEEPKNSTNKTFYTPIADNKPWVQSTPDLFLAHPKKKPKLQMTKAQSFHKKNTTKEMSLLEVNNWSYMDDSHLLIGKNNKSSEKFVIGNTVGDIRKLRVQNRMKPGGLLKKVVYSNTFPAKFGPGGGTNPSIKNCAQYMHKKIFDHTIEHAQLMKKVAHKKVDSYSFVDAIKNLKNGNQTKIAILSAKNKLASSILQKKPVSK